MKSIAAVLLRKAGLDGPFGLEKLPGGRNNRVARIDIGDRKLILKAYFSDPEDPRDRYAAETGFVEFACTNGVTCVNQLLASDAESGAALFNYAEGNRFLPGDVTQDAVDQAMDFVIALNARRDAGRALAPASEACFSLGDHLATAAERIAGLEAGVVEQDAKHFVRDALLPAWSEIAARIRANPNIELNRVLEAQERCISPSDFGFHNAVKNQDGRITFFDFEYAGWDDPAQLVADFFLQLQVPVPPSYRPHVIERISTVSGDTDWLQERVNAVMPVCGIKWCCILMNEFLPPAGRRRRFAGEETDPEKKSRQLELAETVLSRALEPALQSTSE